MGLGHLFIHIDVKERRIGELIGWETPNLLREIGST